MSLSSQTLAASPAFQRAALRSEVRRTVAVMSVLALVSVLVISREFTSDVDDRLPLVGMFGVGALFLLQIGVLFYARWLQRRGRGVPTSFSIATVIIESLIPSGIMLLLIVPHTLPPWAVLSAPPILAYGLLISLTTLRLRPSLCLLAGGVAAGGYEAIVLYVKYDMGIRYPTTGLPRAAYFSFPMLILISGVAAAWVAREIRGYMEAALGEAETRRKMDRIEQDISVAQSIQQALLPNAPPRISGFEIAGWNRPADQTGGDYYDWQALPDGNWIITLADVSGHGIGPALVTAACRAYVRASSHYDGELGALTSRINRLLAEDLPDGRFITMVSVLIDTADGAAAPLGLLSAGHGPLLLLAHATGVVQDLKPQGMPLAVDADTSFGPSQSLSLAPGDVLALITDGFFEWSRPGAEGAREQYGLDRLRESLRRHAHLAAADIVEALAADVATFAGDEPQQDDLTVVIIKRTG